MLPIFKKDENTLLNNYRPISLLPTISKVFEKIVYRQLYSYFASYKLFYNSQHGFKKKHSTETAALEFIDRILQILDSGKIPFAIYLDLSKAFDTLDHDILLHKLRHYGVDGTPLNWFQSYLKGRCQYVQFDDTRSKLSNISTGVPQGSILGPLLFIIYVNDMPWASSKFNSILYADDTTLINSLCSFDLNGNDQNHDSVTNNINSELTKVYNWLNANKLSLNISKTKYMIFHFPQRKLNININLKIEDTNIDRTSEFDFLGLRIQENLLWSAHITKIANKLSRVVGILKRIHKYIPIQALMTIYNSLFLPHLNYAILIWGHSCDRITTLQKKAIRIISSVNFNAHTEPLFKKLNILMVKDLMYQKALNFYFRYCNNELPAYFENMFSAVPITHTYPTRHRHVPRYAIPLHSSVQNCIRFYIPKILTTTPEIILDKIHTHSYTGFSKYFKLFTINNYSERCTVANCYICNR